MLSKVKSRISPKIPPALIFATAQLSLVIVAILSQFNVPRTDFLQGLLAGYSIVGNLYFLISYRKNREEEK